MKKNIPERTQTGLEIAVIGMSGRFPGANDIHTFWDNIKNGRESITFFADEELEREGIENEMLQNPNYVKAKGHIEGLHFFDSSFFKYTPYEASVMDPQLRLFHECAWHALEDAGYDPGTFKGLIGLYAGYTSNLSWKIGRLYQSEASGSAFLELMNLNSDYFTTLICYKLNLRGTSVTVNTACSTSLVAIHLACRSLLTGEAEIVLAGGVTLTLPWKGGYVYQEGMILSPDGHCRPFEVEAKGTSSGNGIGIVVLKRLVKATADGDHIYAIIKGSATNNDGNRKAGYTTLSVEAQSQVIRGALHLSGVKPDSISYIETHGIGTSMGDVLEIEALKKAFSQSTKKNYCCLGFLKANIGHLDAAAGVAGFIKTVLALNHRLKPPAVHFSEPNPAIDFENSPFYINQSVEVWKTTDSPRRAGVSSFGIGGTNAHIILEEWNDDRMDEQKSSISKPLDNQLIVLSAKTRTALGAISKKMAYYLRENPHLNLPDIAYTLQVGRSAFNYREMMICSTRDEVIEELSSLSTRIEDLDTPVKEVIKENPPVIFLFPGIDSHYLNMGLGLYNENSLFRDEIDRCCQILKQVLGYDFKLTLFPSSGGTGTNNQMENFTLGMFVIEYALAQLLLKIGIKPQAMIGDTVGEYAAACIAGVFSLEDVLILLSRHDRERGKPVELNKPEIPFVSSATGKWVTEEEARNNGFWNIETRSTELFIAGLNELKQIEDALYLELGPARVLHLMAQLDMPEKELFNPEPISLLKPLDSDTSDLEHLFNRISDIWMTGVEINWAALYAKQQRKRVSLPGYCFDKLEYTLETPVGDLRALRMEGEQKNVAVIPNRPTLKTDYIAPRDRFEETLISMWEELLGIHPIGIEDDLMELGVNSLKAMTYVNRFKEQWGVLIHVATIFDTPTVSELAEFIQANYPEHELKKIGNTSAGDVSINESGESAEVKSSLTLFDNILLLKKNSSDAGNIFFVHEVSGDIGAYIEFCRLLETNLNCWGVQARRLKFFKPQNRTIEEIAAVYIEKIKNIQPEGPYYLATWSGGGHILFEMALQLEQRDDLIAALIFIDCRGPMARVRNTPAEQYTLESEKKYLKSLFPGTGLDDALEMIPDINQLWPLVVRMLKENPSYTPLVEQYIKQDRMLSLLNFDGQRVEDLIQYQNLSRTFQSAADHYLPARKLHTILHFFEGTEAPADIPVLWNEYCTHPLEKHRMTGDHYTIFQKPLVNEFATVFSTFLKQIS